MSGLYCINPWKKQGQKVYLINGLSPPLSANGGGQGGKTGLYCVSDNMEEDIIKDNFTRISDNMYVTTERERMLLCNHHSPTK